MESMLGGIILVVFLFVIYCLIVNVKIGNEYKREIENGGTDYDPSNKNSVKSH